MNKTISKKNKNSHQQVTQIHEDLKDYLDVLEARKNSLGKKTYTQAEMEAIFCKLLLPL